MMASLGGRQGVAGIRGKFLLTGFPAWFLWRTYYLARLPGIDRRLARDPGLDAEFDFRTRHRGTAALLAAFAHGTGAGERAPQYAPSTLPGPSSEASIEGSAAVSASPISQ